LVCVPTLFGEDLETVDKAGYVQAWVVVSEADVAAIRAAFDRGGELSAVVELRWLFTGITGNENARACARTIAGWTPLSCTLPATP
jgi:hypothetical protein